MHRYAAVGLSHLNLHLRCRSFRPHTWYRFPDLKLCRTDVPCHRACYFAQTSVWLISSSCALLRWSLVLHANSWTLLLAGADAFHPSGTKYTAAEDMSSASLASLSDTSSFLKPRMWRQKPARPARPARTWIFAWDQLTRDAGTRVEMCKAGFTGFASYVVADDARRFWQLTAGLYW